VVSSQSNPKQSVLPSEAPLVFALLLKKLSEASMNQHSPSATIPPPIMPNDPEVLNYFQLRKIVGIIGFALPFVLSIGKWFTQCPGLQPSISAYYYTDMRNFLVGALCGIALFLFATKGYDHRDEIASRFACIFALGVAFFPTEPPSGASDLQQHIGWIHGLSATLLFVTLGFFCLFQFTQTAPGVAPTLMKRKRNTVYSICGYIIFASIGLCGLFGVIDLIEKRTVWPTHLFWFESAAILAFGFAWLVKGKLFLKDK
jgi:hypothetical protein